MFTTPSAVGVVNLLTPNRVERLPAGKHSTMDRCPAGQGASASLSASAGSIRTAILG